MGVGAVLHYARRDEMVYEAIGMDESRDETRRSQAQHGFQNVFVRQHLMLLGLHWFRSTKLARYLVLRLIVVECYCVP
jgi:hypothetical protein